MLLKIKQGVKAKLGVLGGGNGAGENAGPGNGGRQNHQGQDAQPGNFSKKFWGKCNICDGVGHRKRDCPQAINIKTPEMMMMQIRLLLLKRIELGSRMKERMQHL